MKHTTINIILLFLMFAFGSCEQKNTNFPVLVSNAEHQASCVFMTQNAEGNPAISWVEIDENDNKLFFFSQWSPTARNFTQAIAIPVEQNMAVHEEGMPKIAFKNDGSIWTVFETSTPVEGQKWGRGDMRYTVSKDNGMTWSAPESVFKDSTQSLSFGFGNISRLGNGEIAIAALGTDFSLKGHGRPVVFTKTNGDYFEDYITIDEKACECCRTSLSSTPEGNVTVAFRDLTPGSIRDISLSISEDFGQSFRKVTDFSGDNWEIDGCPHNGPSLVKNQQNTYIAWYSGGNKVGVHLAALTHAGELINRLPVNPTGKFIQLALLPEDIVVTAAQQTVQENGKERNQIVVGKVQENKLFEKVLAPDHQQAAFPMIQALGQGQMLVAWKNNQSIYYQVIDAKDITEPAVETKEESLLSMEHHVH